MLIRSLHGAKPFFLGEKCIETKFGTIICTDKSVVIINEEDEGEVWDTTFWKSTAIFLDEPIAKLVSSMIKRLVNERYVSIPEEVASLGHELMGEDVGVINQLKYGYTVKPGAIVIIDEGRFLDILYDLLAGRHNFTLWGYTMGELLREKAEIVIELIYATPMLWYVVLQHKHEVAKQIDRALREMLAIDVDSEKHFYEPYNEEISLDEYAHEVAGGICGELDVSIDCVRVEEVIGMEMYEFVRECVDRGCLPGQYLHQIAVAKDWKRLLEGCEAAKAVYDFLPERDREIVKKSCG